MSSQLRLQQQHLRLQKKLYEKKNQLPPSKPILPSENFVITPSSPICIMKIGVDTDMIFDKNSEITLLYASPRLDKSNDVISKLGYKPGTINK